MRSIVASALLACSALLWLAPAPAEAQELQIDVVARVSGKFVAPKDTDPPGFDIDILRRFASWHQVKTGKAARLQFRYADTVPALLDAVKGGADIGVGGVTATAERARLVDFSIPVLPVRSVVIAPPGVLDATRWRQQLGGLRVGATVGSTNAAHAERLAAGAAGAKIDTTFTTNEAVFAALGANPRRLDVAVVDLPQFWVAGKAIGMVMVDSVGDPQNMAFVLAKGSPLKAQLDQFLDGFTHSSEYFQLVRRYFGQDAEKMVRLARGGQ
jgi:ABC-type amino acid transport substrate-binding protein